MPKRVAYLGPKGTFAEEAACILAKLENLDTPEFLPCKGLHSVVRKAANKDCEAAVVPIENSVEGGVTATLDSLWTYPSLFITRALVLPIKHALFSNGSLDQISEVLSHPQALAQCSGWLNSNLSEALQLPTNSTSEAVKMVKGSKFRAAIGPRATGNAEGLQELAYPVNDIEGNCTRFVLLQSVEAKEPGNLASFAFSIRSNKPGALLEILNCMANLDLNMSRIESRPSKRELGEYVFFVDIELNKRQENKLIKLKELLNPICENIVQFGCYPSSTI